MLKEFREFVARGNVIDLAVGVIMGAAFGRIVTTLVEGVIMPPLGLLLGRTDFSGLFFVLDSTYMAPPQVSWLREELKRSDAKWKISYFHHPIYSSGERHGSELDLQVIVEPLFLENGVDVVFSGHEHFYERLRPQKGIQYMIQGGAAKLRRGNIRDNSPMTAKGFDTDRSFTLIEINGDHLFFETISRLGEVVDSGSFPRREIAEATSTN